eukprot:TRINITY_DN44561_c0_g2_i1.p1 TRINITY_DN44561_c0_g2~~TRINITY_DN44561_c0_g2_i1.p1  ORF type:complete len:388 (-),score=110.73 TRINITY_DN44561_c0_g2_i1:172-1335(-)
MRQIGGSAVTRGASGSVNLICDEEEDMWHAFNLIVPHDQLRANTIRKVQKSSSTGSTSSQKMRLSLTLDIESVEFDKDKCSLRIKGRNIEENEHVKMGAYHTIDLELNKRFTLSKDVWDTIFVERLKTACDFTEKADVAALLMNQDMANLCLIGGHMTVWKAKVEHSIPKKRVGSSRHTKAVDRFYSIVSQALEKSIDFEKVKCIIIASAGFVKESFFKHMMEKAEKEMNKTLLSYRDKFLLVHSSSGHRCALKEVLADPGVQTQLRDTKAAEEMTVLEKFFDFMHSDPSKVTYGMKSVQFAVEQGAVESLLVSDSLFRSMDFALRRNYVKLVDDCKDMGGRVLVFSTMHMSGQQLEQICGVAAILRFPITEVEESDDESSGSEDDY